MKHSRIAYTVSRKNPLLWIAVILALAAAVGFFLRLSGGSEAGELSRFWFDCLLCVLPGLGALYFAYQLAVNGKERIFRLSLPLWLLTVGAVFRVWNSFAWYYALLLSLALLGIAWLAHGILRGTLLSRWALVLPVGLLLAGTVLLLGVASPLAEDQSLWSSLRLDAEAILLLAYLPLIPAIRKLEDGKYHPTWGDRFDGRRIRSLSPISVVGTYVMPERNQANVFSPTSWRSPRWKNISGTSGPRASSNSA